MNRKLSYYLSRDDRMRDLTLAIAFPLLFLWTLFFFASFTFEVQYDHDTVDTALGGEVRTSRTWHIVPRKDNDSGRRQRRASRQ